MILLTTLIRIPKSNPFLQSAFALHRPSLIRSNQISQKQHFHGAEVRTSLFSIINSSATTENIPWKNSSTEEDTRLKSRNKRFRQHVNPLAAKFQQPTTLSPNWPNEFYSTPCLPLFLDIGCGKGGFLLSYATHGNDADDYNFLGLEIRPSVAEYAQSRVSKHGLDGKLSFVGCNANVDLDRLLTEYHRETRGGKLGQVCIQFPDPHFKKRNEKRRVVNKELVSCLIRHCQSGVRVLIQSDVKEVFDDMRIKFREFGEGYFEDIVEDIEKYLEENPLGIMTEREISVLEQDLPVYRTLFVRTDLVAE